MLELRVEQIVLTGQQAEQSEAKQKASKAERRKAKLKFRCIIKHKQINTGRENNYWFIPYITNDMSVRVHET